MKVKLLIDSLPALVHTGLPDGYLDFFNQTWLEYVGLSLEDIQGWNWTVCIHPDDVEGIVERWRASLASGEPFLYEARVRRADGEYRWMLHHKIALRDEQGEIVKWYGSSIDIEDRKRAEENLRRSEAYLAEAQRLSRTGSFGWNLFSGEIFWSEETFRIFEYDRTTKPSIELVLERVHPEDKSVVQQLIDRASQDAKDFDYEYRLLMPDGSVKYVHVLAHAVSAESGNIEFVGAVMDVTERKRAGETLRRSEAYLAEAQKLSHTASFAYNPGRRKTLYWSEELFRIFGLDPQRGIPDYNETRGLVHPDDLDRVSGECLQGFREKADFTQDYRLLLHDGTVKHLHVIWHPVLDKDGEVMEYVGTAADVTERKRAEQALRRSEALLAEAQRLSHTGSFGWSVSSGEIFWSEETFRIFECDQAIQPTVEMVLRRTHPEDTAIVQQTIDRASRDEKDFDLEYRLLMPGGSIKYVHVVAHGIRNELAQIEFVGAVTDITATKTAEERIRQDERELRQLIDFVPQHIVIARPDGTRLYANQGMLEYHGMTLKEIQADDFYTKVFHPEDLTRVMADRHRGIAAGASWEAEARLRRKDGQYRWFLIRSNSLRDERGAIIRWYTTATDIEDRKQAEEKVQRENVALREEIDKTSMFEEIVGTSRPLRAVLSSVTKVAPTDSTVLITGETGTGKELIARAIHKMSRRSSRAFVSVNCAAIPQSLIASELFGHEKGAFTGALQRRLGRFELAEGGTIFLDEIGDLPADTQNALLRVLQEREFERVGGSQTIRADVRVIAATNSDLKAAMITSAFRSDLFYRLNVFPIEIPPLRERREDIPMLVEYFIDRYASKAGKKIKSINKESLKLLQSYPWPGNIREIQNVIERAVIVCETEALSIDDNWLSRESFEIQPLSTSLSEELVAREKEKIEAALAETKGRVSGPWGAAAKLGIPRSTLDSKIRSLKINTHRFKTV